MFIVRFSINFCISFIILSIPINDKVVFNHLYELTSSTISRNVDEIKEKTKKIAKEKINQKKIVLKRAVPNFSSSPLSLSSPKVSRNKEKNIIKESYTDEEQEAMRRVFENRNP